MTSGPELLTPGSLPIPSGRENNFWYVRNESETVIVFVHGVFSASRSCWLSESQGGSPRVFWPDLIRTDPRLGDPSIFLGGYHTSLDSGDYSLTECATELRDALRLPDTAPHRSPFEYSRLIFLCHSTGGIVVRYVINRYKEEFKSKHIGLALMASPSLGSGWADAGAMAARFYNQRLGQQLSWDDSELQDLHWQFSELVNNRAEVIPGLFGREAAEHRMIGREILPKWARRWLPSRGKVVEKLSAAQYFGQVRQIPNTDHFSIVKPNGVDHPSHQFLVGFMTDFIEFSNRSTPTSLPRLVEGFPAAPKQSATAVENSDWPTPIVDSVRLYLADADFEGVSARIVMACVVVDDVTTLEERWRAAIESISEDPVLHADSAAADAIHRRRFNYREAAPAFRTRLSALLRSLTFEAYVSFANQSGDEDTLCKELVRAIVFDRLRAYRTRDIVIDAGALSPRRRESASDAIQTTAARVRELHRSPTQPQIAHSDLHSAGSAVAHCIAEIVRERLERGPAATDFDLVHPTKVRVMYDHDSHHHYSRHDPFQG